MTKTVTKGTNRPAAAARTNRHAQRTPLPPKPGVVEAAREVLAEAAQMAVAAPDRKSQEKAKAFAERAAAAKWNTVLDESDRGVEATVTRGPEQIVQAWVNGVWQYDASIYAFADRTTKPRNAAGAARLLERSAEDAAAEMAKVETNKSFRRREPSDIKPMVLPFEIATATDSEVSKFMRGQTVKWYNRFRRVPETAMVGRNTKIYLTYYHGDPIVNWCCPVTGFRSCRLDAILGMGRGRLLSAETSEIELEEVA